MSDAGREEAAFAALARSLAGALSIRVEPLLRDIFFQGHEALAEAVLAQTTADRLHHIGVEISRPLDEIERDLDGLLVRLGQATGGRVELAWRRRFPASEAFRRRAGAAAEILCLCLGVDGRTALLELFDLHRPPSERDTTLPPHYAVGLGSRRAVERLHREFAALAKRQPRYVLAYSAPVENRRDGSFHTKLVNLALGMELEFCVAGDGLAPTEAMEGGLSLEPEEDSQSGMRQGA